MAVETKVVPYDKEAQAALEQFYKKWSELLSDVGILPQPLRGIAEFVKSEGEKNRRWARLKTH